jgi:hypothetical protein
LEEAVEAWNGQEMEKELRVEGIQWHFGPPNASHWGGVYERLVQCSKKHLKVLLTENVLDSDVFVTVLKEVESTLNKRPLTQVSSDSRDPEALTPFGLICPGVVICSSIGAIPPAPSGMGIDLERSWQKGRDIVAEFWRRWSDEYVSTLLERKKWKTAGPGVRVGQLVLLISEMPRDKWKLGMVDEIGVGSDGLVREAVVRLGNGGRFRRHVNALVVLEMD